MTPIDGWTVESLSRLLIENGCSRYLAGRHGPNLFEEVPPTPTPDRPGAPRHPATPCMVWRFSKSVDGYGRVWDGTRQNPAHVLAYEYSTGTKIPAGLVLAHSCEVPACARPDHVAPLTHQDNLRESANRVYSDEILALAVEPGPCPRCGKSGRTPSAWRHSAGHWCWRWTCGPCTAAYARGENTMGRYKEGDQRRKMPPEHVAALMRHLSSRVPDAASA